MNQEKIGKFILNLRKEKNMTQQELAEKLKVTDRAISNWENGKNMPDLSLFKSICDVFDITINELLSGEKLQKDEYQEKLEENIINTVIYEKAKRKTYKKIFCYTLVTIIIFIIVLFGSLFIIDNERMSENKPVLFSTWGNKNYIFSYEYSKQNMDKYIKRYFLRNMAKTYTNDEGKTFNVVNFVVTHIFDIDRKSNEEIIVYLQAINGSRLEKYYDEDSINNFEMGMPVIRPYKIILKESENHYYEVVKVYEPDNKTGMEYIDAYLFMKKYFPKKVFKKADKFDKTLMHKEYYDMLSNYEYQ